MDPFETFNFIISISISFTFCARLVCIHGFRFFIVVTFRMVNQVSDIFIGGFMSSSYRKRYYLCHPEYNITNINEMFEDDDDGLRMVLVLWYLNESSV